MPFSIGDPIYFKNNFHEICLNTFGELILRYTYNYHTIYLKSKSPFNCKRKNSNKRDRERLYINQNHKCYWCNCDCKFNTFNGDLKKFTVDHVLPINVGGNNHWLNLVGSCQECNLRRGRHWEHLRIIKFNK